MTGRLNIDTLQLGNTAFKETGIEQSTTFMQKQAYNSSCIKKTQNSKMNKLKKYIPLRCYQVNRLACKIQDETVNKVVAKMPLI